jgi:hypothetical protein
MAHHVRSMSMPQTEQDYYKLIQYTLSNPTVENVAKAQNYYDLALEKCIWNSPLGDMGCSFETHMRSAGNYAIMSQRMIESAREALNRIPKR